MQIKKKICAGCNEEQYIFKNINGKKYCRSCAYKLEPPKQISKRTEKQVFKLKIKKDLIEEDKKFYLKVWEERTQGDKGMDIMIHYPRCECCNIDLGSEPNMMNFHHILEKRNYPQYRHKEWNIAILCSHCHNRYETMPDTVPILVTKREFLLSLHEHEILKNKNQ
jgi:5-methylcytosine-specific restriction endonuclease McrA